MPPKSCKHAPEKIEHDQLPEQSNCFAGSMQSDVDGSSSEDEKPITVSFKSYGCLSWSWKAADCKSHMLVSYQCKHTSTEYYTLKYKIIVFQANTFGGENEG